MEPILIAYIPVLHEGYRRLFAKHPEARELCLFGDDVIASFEHLAKDIRKLDPKLVRDAIDAWHVFDRVTLLDANRIAQLQTAHAPLIVPDDDLTTELVQNYFGNNPVERDTIFLRWDKKKSIEPTKISPDVVTSESDIDQEFMAIAQTEGQHSRDWWRRIGALAVKDGKILLRAHNVYLPSDQIANDEGDPRSNFHGGVHLESSLALHAEAALVAQAAKEGISLSGADIYADTFPCPPCAKQLAYSGIRRLYYRNGYGVLDGERILRSHGVEIIFVRPSSDTLLVARI